MKPEYFIAAFFGLSVGFLIGYLSTTWEWQRETVRRGVATYNDNSWQWKH